ncbi:hypothetical protein M3Y98_00887400 [Aphelenchoides besseyi]|nr:hypothetical protein M3Y98_00887400 [Aphelenchoides besseyi]
MTKDVCLCGTNVHTGARVVGIISAIFAIIQLVGALVHSATGGKLAQHIVTKDNHTNGNDTNSLYNYVPENLPDFNGPTFVLTFITLTFAVLLIVGVQKRVRALYYPFIVWTVISTVLYILVFVIMTFGFIVFFLFASSTKSGTGFYVLMIVSLLIFVFVGFSIWLQFYFFYIVPKRSLDVLTEEQTMRIANGQQKQEFEYSNRV